MDGLTCLVVFAETDGLYRRLLPQANELFETAYDDIDAKGTVNRARINKLREQHRKNPS
eukprot:m.93326 g.93326  ORF g.93326 m.93326 type:complete len:59 (+) comp16532_c0_seq2:2590-2766(+)